MSRTQSATPLWTVLAPLAALAFIALEMLVLSEALASLLMLPAAALLFASVFAAVHHAETIAHRVGQPFGSIILALAVTVIEVDNEPPASLLASLRAAPGIIRVLSFEL
ncbi:MAG: hypothetical protein ACNA7F_15190 [Roseovarius sp.]